MRLVVKCAFAFFLAFAAGLAAGEGTADGDDGEAAEAETNDGMALREELEDIFRSVIMSVVNRDRASLEALCSPEIIAAWDRLAASPDAEGEDAFALLADELADWDFSPDPEHVAPRKMIVVTADERRAWAARPGRRQAGAPFPAASAAVIPAAPARTAGEGRRNPPDAATVVLVYLDLARDDALADLPAPSLGGEAIVKPGARDGLGRPVRGNEDAPWRVFHWLRFLRCDGEDHPRDAGWLYDGGAWFDRPADYLAGAEALREESDLRVRLGLPPVPEDDGEGGVDNRDDDF